MRPHGPGTLQALTESRILPDGVAFTGEFKLVRKATGYEQEKAEAALSHIGFAGCASRASGAHWSVSVTHRFLRRGKDSEASNSSGGIHSRAESGLRPVSLSPCSAFHGFETVVGEKAVESVKVCGGVHHR